MTEAELHIDPMVKATFEKYDVDKSGDICVKELLHALVDCGVDADAKHTKEVCAKYDLDGNGKLCIKEFAVLVQDAMHGSVAGDAPNVDPVVLSVFRKHDKDGSGAIEASELKEVLKECDYEVDDAKLAETLKHYDLDNNQSLCLKEFEMLLRDFMY
jgi:Ca2+-binding EF-hand superfamily protein|eukprot:CAMPEP_0174295106 /NCGR_PEP_ID=MMETSP0809-20121228/43681_1 /TAXON_ID=73025 ORGANISM="Eutreptiella gymnastica-like, Strain CCMP1594" /NCGR_SAMPLE_ID=MMETSP0809 /ASSEMBLY_ACC=CAM_ASM_000658 /LENGTH=156 /DNA_ID=CAMNT_0015397095 /DNA_START=30 /DNA_END=500 /DNA_ORIENTATION=+